MPVAEPWMAGEQRDKAEGQVYIWDLQKWVDNVKFSILAF